MPPRRLRRSWIERNHNGEDQMPTGSKHQKFTDIDDEPGVSYGEDCRCTIGEDHNNGDDTALSNYLSESDAEDIWLSSGMDEDYDFR